MEQRHADVAHVVGAEVHDHAHAVAGDEQPALRADDGLGRVRGPAGEDQRPDRVDRRLEAGIGRRRTPRARPRGVEPTSSTGGSRSAIGASSARCPGSVMTRPQWVCSMSRSRCSPRRVWLRPTIAGAGERRAAEREEVLGRRCRAAPRRAAARRAGSRSRNRFAHRLDSATYSPWVQTRSSNRTAGRLAIVGSAAFRRRSAAAFSAGERGLPGGRRGPAGPGDRT